MKWPSDPTRGTFFIQTFCNLQGIWIDLTDSMEKTIYLGHSLNIGLEWFTYFPPEWGINPTHLYQVNTCQGSIFKEILELSRGDLIQWREQWSMIP